MALIKQLDRRGVTASYFYLESLRFAKTARQASAIFGLCVDKEHRAAVKRRESAPLESHVATVRITGDTFDHYFPPGVRVAKNIEAQIFKAIKAGKAEIKMDEGPGFFGDAGDDD